MLEDEPSVAGLLNYVLSKYYVLLESATADEALRRFVESDGHVDLLIADVTLPVSSGIRVALELRSLNPSLKIILTSGYPRSIWPDQDSAELDEIPSDSVATLQKPFTPATLLNMVGRLINPLSKAAGAGSQDSSLSKSD